MYTKSQNWANFGLTCVPEKGRGFVTVYARLPQIWSQKMRETSKKKVMKRRGEIKRLGGGGVESAPACLELI